VVLLVEVTSPVRLPILVTVPADPEALPVKAPTKAVEVIEVAPVTTPSSTLIVPSKTIAEPFSGCEI
jgi:hypothetical protein